MDALNKNTIGKLADNVFRLIDHSCGVDPVEDYDRAIKFRLLMLVSVVSFISVSITLANALILSTALTPPKIVGVVCIVVIVTIPVLLITTQKIALPAAIFCITAMAGITSGLVFNGGLQSHFIVNLPLVSVVAGWLINMRAGVVAGAVSISIFLFLGSDFASLVVIPTALSPEQLNTMRMSNAISTTVSALVVVRCFQLATKHAIADAREAQHAANRANRAKSVFLANMSHELRTPLNGVVAVAGTLQKTDLNDDQSNMVDLITSSGQTLERLLSDVLDVSKIEAGRLEIEKVPFDFKELVQNTVDLFRPAADEKNLAYDLTFGPNLPPALLGDPTRVRQMLTNLLSNAVKFTSDGSIHVNAHVDKSVQGQPSLVLSVRDTGIGFDTASSGTLFDPFTQEDGSINRRFGGTGLGLFICKSLVEAMNGEITVNSKPGAGSQFTIEIPTVCLTQLLPKERAIEAAHVSKRPEDSNSTSCVSEDKPGATGDALQILLVEDHLTNRKIVELILGPLDVEITSVENGQEALAAFQSNKFDLILMDMQMPVMDGLVATKEIRRLEADQGLARTPLAMLTANAMANHITDALEAGADTHIAKPVTPDTLIANLSDLLKKTSQKRLLAA